MQYRFSTLTNFISKTWTSPYKKLPKGKLQVYPEYEAHPPLKLRLGAGRTGVKPGNLILEILVDIQKIKRDLHYGRDCIPSGPYCFSLVDKKIFFFTFTGRLNWPIKINILNIWTSVQSEHAVCQENLSSSFSSVIFLCDFVVCAQLSLLQWSFFHSRIYIYLNITKL